MSVELVRGSAALLISMPHLGTQIPATLRDRYVARAHAVEDTDWHLDQLYDFATELGASVLKPYWSRYVIDLNRPPDDVPMYPGASNTELCPTRFFTGDHLYREGAAPDAAERQQRRVEYWQPYHDALQTELARIRAKHGYVLLWDAHSIRSEIPWLFEGKLPDLNIGSANGLAADARITTAVAAACATTPSVTHAVNGRFKGGFITRHYGQPDQGIQAVQLEKCQSLYMQEVAQFSYDSASAARIKPVLKSMVGAALDATKAIYGD
jgi:N-formylglutamate deformylase